jgi:hypothetical protein
MSDNGYDPFAEALTDLGFALAQEDRKGVRQYARPANRFLIEWVHDYGDDALFTWEFDLGAFCGEQGWQIGAAEPGAHILYPQFDARLERDIEAVAAEVRRVEGQLSQLNLADPSI